MKNAQRTVFAISLFCYISLAMAEEISSSVNNGKFSLYNEHHYYSWRDDRGNKGYQYASPITLSYQKGAFNAGLRRAFIVSENQSPNRVGRVSHWSDTSLSFAYTTKYYPSTPIRFNLSMNLPNGKASLSGNEKNAVMDGHLVWQTRFGEGFNITPGINVSHALTEKDTVGIGFSHSFKGKFDPDADRLNDSINPGDISTLALQYQHNEKNWFVQPTLNYQYAGVSQRNNKDSYQKGGLWQLGINGAYAFTPKQTLRMNYSYSYRSRDKVFNQTVGELMTEQFNSNGDSHFINLDYGYRLNDHHSLHLMGSYLKIDGNEYDRVNSLYLPSRQKWSVGTRYSAQINKQLSLSLQAKYFQLKEATSPHYAQTTTGSPTIEEYGEKYNGWNISANLQYQF